MCNLVGNDSLPSYSIEAKGDRYQIAVKLPSNPTASIKETMLQEAKKSSLMGMAYIHALAQQENLTAQHITSIYDEYRSFFVSRDREHFLELCDSLLADSAADEFVQHIAFYLKEVLEYQKATKSEGSGFIKDLIPSIKHTLLLSPPTLVYSEQLVKIPEMNANHNAFPDLIKFNGYYYVCFREGKEHVAYQDFGKVRILQGVYFEEQQKWEWNNAGLLSLEPYDLRDPKFFIDSNHQLHIIVDGSIINEKNQTAKMVPHVAHFIDGNWTIEEAEVDHSADGPEGQWIWKVTWNQQEQAGYGFAYGKGTSLSLMKTSDARSFEKIAEVETKELLNGENVNEAAIQFQPNGKAMAFIRSQRRGLVGVSSSSSSYKEWTFSIIPYRVGGPNFAFSNDQQKVWAATRHFFLNKDNTLDETTIVGAMDEKRLVPLLRLKSAGDNSYPGIVMEQDNSMTIVYYATVPGETTNIYVTRVSFPE